MSIIQSRNIATALLALALAAIMALGMACGDDDDDGTTATNTPAVTQGSSATAAPTGTPLEPIKVRATQAIEAASFLPVYAARYNDFYAEEGIDLEFTAGATGGQESQALLSGGADMVFSSGAELLKLAAQDRDVIAVGGIEIGGVDVLVMEDEFAAEHGITHDSPLADKLNPDIWRGATVGFTAPGALSNGLVLYWATQAGVAIDEVNQLALGGGATQIAGIQQNQVDFISTFHPFSDQMVAQGIAVELIDMTQTEDPSLEGWMEQIIITTRDYAQNNPEAVRRFVKATVRGAQWVNEHSVDEVTDMWASFEAFKTLDRQILFDQVQAYQDGGIFPNDGAMPLKGLEVVQDVAVGAGIIEKPIDDLASLIVTDYLPEN